jgi:hypothetical protein
MARGWESKSVESQQAEASEAGAPKGDRPLTVEARAARTERRTLELARARLQADLETAAVPAHREMLARALGDVDRRIGDLLRPPSERAPGGR